MCYSWANLVLLRQICCRVLIVPAPYACLQSRGRILCAFTCANNGCYVELCKSDHMQGENLSETCVWPSTCNLFTKVKLCKSGVEAYKSGGVPQSEEAQKLEGLAPEQFFCLEFLPPRVVDFWVR